jgi:hypothetical protein
MNPIHRRAVIHFTDATTLDLEWPKQDTKGCVFLSEAIRKAIESERLLVEVEGNLLVIPMRNVKYIELIPVPEQLPDGVIRNARHRVQPSPEGAPVEDKP